MIKFLKQLFTWWNGETLNTRFAIWRKGEFVGTDEFGNRYYRAKSAIPELDSGASLGRVQRLLGGVCDPAWLAWLDASPRCATAIGRLPAARVAEASPTQSDRNAAGLSAAGQHRGLWPAGRARARLPGLAARMTRHILAPVRR